MERLDPRVRLIWFVRVLFFSAVAAVVTALAVGNVGFLRVTSPGVAAGAVFGVLGLVGTAHLLLRYRAWRFEVREDTLYIERGVLVSVRTVVPYVRVQHVDSRRGPFQRALGLASVVVYTAGSRGADVSIPGLTAERADEAQETLRRLAIESEPTDGDAGDAV